MIYTSKDMNYGLAQWTIPVAYTLLRGYQISWQQAITEDMDIDENIGFFTKRKDKRYANKRNYTTSLNPKRRNVVIRTIVKSEKQEIKFAKGVSIIE